MSLAEQARALVDQSSGDYLRSHSMSIERLKEDVINNILATSRGGIASTFFDLSKLKWYNASYKKELYDTIREYLEDEGFDVAVTIDNFEGKMIKDYSSFTVRW